MSDVRSERHVSGRVRQWAQYVLVALIVTLTAAAATWAQGDTPSTSHDVAALYASRSPTDVPGLRTLQRHLEAVAEVAVSCTVGVVVGLSHGSGVIVSPDGHVLTAAHVIGPAGTEAQLVLGDGRTLRGKVLGRVGTADAGLIKITQSGTWPFARMSRSEGVLAGQWCVATGYPGGYEGGAWATLRAGRVTGAWRGTLRTDCPLIHGDSGGPLFDLAGEVIGIHSRVGRPVAANLHVPIQSYRRNWNRLLAGGDDQTTSPATEMEDGESGTLAENPRGSNSGQDRDRALRRQIRGPSARNSGKNHELVRLAFRQVISRANQATVRFFVQDQLVALGAILDTTGHIVTKASQLRRPLVCRLADGRKMAANVLAVDRDHDLALVKISCEGLRPLTLSRDEDLPVGAMLASPGGFGDRPIAVGVVSRGPHPVHSVRLGIRVGQSAKGPVIGRIEGTGPAAQAGLLSGDLIAEMNGQPLETTPQLLRRIRQHRPGDVVRLGILRGTRRLERRVTLAAAGEPDAGPASSLADPNQLISRRRFDFPLVIQHDSPLSANQCGGPLVDLNGKVVGINIARASRVASYAIPAEDVIPVIQRLRAAAAQGAGGGG